METVKNLSLIITIMINTGVLVGVILKVSNVVFNIKQSISDCRNLILQTSTELTNKNDRNVNDVSRDIEATNHSIQIIDIRLKELSALIMNLKSDCGRDLSLRCGELKAELKDIESELNGVKTHLRDLENFTQKQFPEFHVRG